MAWFDNGIKRISGIPVYFSEIGAAIDGRYPITRLGTVFDITFTEGAIRHSGSYTLEKDSLFTAASQTRIFAGMSPMSVVASGSRRINDLTTPYLVYRTSDKEYDDYGYNDHWFGLNQEQEYGQKIWTGYIQSYNKDLRHWNDVEIITGSSIGGDDSYNIITTIANGVSSDPLWQFQRGYSYKTNQRLYTDNAFLKTSGNKMKATFINNPGAQRIELHPILSGFGVKESYSVLNIYDVESIKPEILMVIPYSILNNTDYFDPDEDKADPRPDGPDWDGDTSGPGGGDGNYQDYPDEPVGFPSLPSISAIDTGFLTMYNPSSAELQALVDYLWTSDWVDTIKKMVSNPMDAIIGLNIIPYDPGTYVASTCKIGAILTGISMNKVTEQYKVLDCGSVSVPEHWGNALDYNNVNISVALPFVGIRTLDTNLVMNSTVSLKYYVDLLTGSAIAMLEISKSNTTKSVYYNFECNLNYQIPVTGANYAETIKALMSTVSSGIGLASSAATSNAAGALSSATNMIASAFMAGSGAHHYESSGNLSANIGILGQFQPYIIVELPKQSLPANFKKNKGYTSNITASLGSLSGYTEASYFHLDGIPATDQEKNLIDNALRSGVIL